MNNEEARKIRFDFFLNILLNHAYHGHLHGCYVTTRREAAEKGLLPDEESLEGLCMIVGGSLDKLPLGTPRPKNPYKGLLLVYDQKLV